MVIPGAAQAQPPENPAAVREQLEQLRARIESIQAELQAETARRDALRAELAAAERRIGAAARALHEVAQSLILVQDRLQQLEQEQDALTAALAAQQAQLAASVRAAFLMGREPRLKVLLNQEDAAAIGRVLAYYHYLQQARVARIQRVNAQLARLVQVEVEIARQQEQLAVLRAQREAELAAERAALAERGQALAKIQDRIQRQGTELAVLARDERALEQLLAQLEQVLADIPPQLAVPFASLKGQLPAPLAGDYPARAEDAGLLIPAAEGTPVQAIAPGRVAYADWLRGYGLLIILDHGDGYMSLYAHNHSLFRDVGEWVQAGEVISEVGKSGGRDQAALYFEIRHDAEPISVLAWLDEG